MKINKIIFGILAILLLSSFAFATNTGWWTLQTSLLDGVIDQSTSENDIGIYNGVTYDATKNAFHTDGVNDYINSNILLVGETDQTISFWMNMPDTSSKPIMGAWTTNLGSVTATYDSSSGLRTGWRDGSEDYIDGGYWGTLSANTWYHVVLVYDSQGTVHTYVNAVDHVGGIVASTIGDPSATNTVVFGQRKYSDGYGEFYFSGIIFWSDAKTPTEVAELYAEGRDYNAYVSTSTPNMTITSSFYAGEQLLTFNATVNGTDYQTTNGTIQTDINTTDTIEIEIQTEYFTQTFSNWETPEDLIFNYSVLNISAKNIRSNSTIEDFNLTLNDYNTTLKSNNSEAIIYLNDTSNSPLNVTISNPTIATHTEVLTFTGDNITNKTLYVYETNSININVYDVSSGELMNVSVNVQFNLDGNLTSNDIADGNLFVYNLTAGNYSLTFTATGFTTVAYDALVSNFSTQTLNAYMTPTATGQSTIFAFKNIENEAIVEGVSLSVERIIEDVWTLVNVLSSDVSGRAQFEYETGVKYRFTASKTGWETREFTLNPVIFSSYNIWLTQEIEETQEQDLSGVNILAYPGTYYNSQNNTVELIFLSPDGRLEEYGFSATYKDVSIAGSGSNLYGGSLSDLLLIENATLGDQVNLYYYYRLSDGTLKEFNSPYLIADTATPATHWNNKDNHYGMGLAERILIVILLVILVAGSAYMFGGAIAGGIIAMLIFGYFLFIGFVSGWLVIPSMIFIFIFTAWGATK